MSRHLLRKQFTEIFIVPLRKFFRIRPAVSENFTPCLLAGRKAPSFITLCVLEMDAQRDQIFERAGKPPGSLSFLRTPPFSSVVIKNRARYGISVPLIRICLQKIDGLSLITGDIFKMFYCDTRQVQISGS